MGYETIRRLKHLAAGAAVVAALAAPTAAFAGPTVVSVTFDDGLANQYQVRTMLSQYSLHGTFYVNSGYIGTSGTYMTWDQLTGLASDGNEIGGHAVGEVDLTSVSPAEAQADICTDRQAIISHGFTVTDFAYPYGAENSSIWPIVQGCGYSSARRAWGLCAIGTQAANCTSDFPVAENVPPHNVWATATIPSIRSWNTLSDLESVVTRAEGAGGGWVTLPFHNICDNDCAGNGYSTSPSALSGFLGWLSQQTSAGVYVRTVRDVVSDTTPPTSTIACNGAACSSWYSAPVTVSLSASDTGTAVAAIRYTTDGSDPTASSLLYTGPFTLSSTTTLKYRAWDMGGNVEPTNTSLIQFDTTPPSSSILCNANGCTSSWYSAAVTVTLSATDTGSGVASVRYTTDGSDPTVSSPLYAGPFAVSTTTTVKFRAWDNAGNLEATESQLIQIDTTAPTVSISSPTNGVTVTGNVKIVATPADAQSGVASVKFYVDGALVGTVTGSPWQVAWNTKKFQKGSHQLTAAATDSAGNSMTSTAVTVTVR